MKRRSAPIATLVPVIRERGWTGTLALLFAYLSDRWLDLRSGLDTTSWVRLQDLAFDSPFKHRGVDCQPTYRLPLLRLLRRLDLPKDAIFLDVGSGKGRGMLVAVEYGFKTVRGVEFSPELRQIALANWERVRSRIKSTAVFEIVCGCATEYRFRDESVIFLFNPFDDVVLDLVMRNLLESLERHPRPVWILYRRPAHRQVLENVPGIRLLGDHRYWGSDFAVFTLDPRE